MSSGVYLGTHIRPIPVRITSHIICSLGSMAYVLLLMLFVKYVFHCSYASPGRPGPQRQNFEFVAMPLGHGYTIEEQVTGQANQGGIQIDVFPSLEESVRFRTGLQESDSDGNDLSLLHTPKDLGVHVGSQVEMMT